MNIRYIPGCLNLFRSRSKICTVFSRFLSILAKLIQLSPAIQQFRPESGYAICQIAHIRHRRPGSRLIAVPQTHLAGGVEVACPNKAICKITIPPFFCMNMLFSMPNYLRMNALPCWIFIKLTCVYLLPEERQAFWRCGNTYFLASENFLYEARGADGPRDKKFFEKRFTKN